MADEDVKTVDQLNEEADIAADYLEELLDIIDYDGDIELAVRNNRPTVQIVADDDEDIKNLIGRHGEVVNALQQLSRFAVQQKTGDRSHLILDVDGYLTRRRKHVEDIALDAVDEVRETGEPVSLRSMNSFERKIVHDIVREEGLKSRSHGVEPDRYVTVYLRAQDSSVDDGYDGELDNGGPDDPEFDEDEDFVSGSQDGSSTDGFANRYAHNAADTGSVSVSRDYADEDNDDETETDADEIDTARDGDASDADYVYHAGDVGIAGNSNVSE